MSANNWDTCPRCKKKLEATRAKAAASAEKEYGKVPPDEYLTMVKAAKLIGGKLEQTLREDWEIGVDEDGRFYVSYSGSCRAGAAIVWLIVR